MFAVVLRHKNAWFACALLLLAGCEAKLNEAQKETRSLEQIR